LCLEISFIFQTDAPLRAAVEIQPARIEWLPNFLASKSMSNAGKDHGKSRHPGPPIRRVPPPEKHSSLAS
jgi:hypothetical protein